MHKHTEFLCLCSVCLCYFYLLRFLLLLFYFFYLNALCDAAVSFSARQKFSLYPHDLFLLIVRKDEKETEHTNRKENEFGVVSMSEYMWQSNLTKRNGLKYSISYACVLGHCAMNTRIRAMLCYVPTKLSLSFPSHIVISLLFYPCICLCMYCRYGLKIFGS